MGGWWTMATEFDPFAGPVIETLAGARARVAAMSLRQRWQWSYRLGLAPRDWDYDNALAHVLWWHGRRRRRPHEGL